MIQTCGQDFLRVHLSYHLFGEVASPEASLVSFGYDLNGEDVVDTLSVVLCTGKDFGRSLPCPCRTLVQESLPSNHHLVNPNFFITSQYTGRHFANLGLSCPY